MSRGYQMVILQNLTPFGMHKKNIRVHRLVLENFGGIKSGHHAAHRNGDRMDNRIENLYWATPKENSADRKRHGTAPRRTGEKRNKLCWSDVNFIRASGNNPAFLAKQFGVCERNIHMILSHTTWK